MPCKIVTSSQNTFPSNVPIEVQRDLDQRGDRLDGQAQTRQARQFSIRLLASINPQPAAGSHRIEAGDKSAAAEPHRPVNRRRDCSPACFIIMAAWRCLLARMNGSVMCLRNTYNSAAGVVYWVPVPKQLLKDRTTSIARTCSPRTADACMHRGPITAPTEQAT